MAAEKMHAASMRAESEHLPDTYTAIHGPPFRLDTTMLDAALGMMYVKFAVVLELASAELAAHGAPQYHRQLEQQREAAAAVGRALEAIVYRVPWLAAHLDPVPGGSLGPLWLLFQVVLLLVLRAVNGAWRRGRQWQAPRRWTRLDEPGAADKDLIDLAAYKLPAHRVSAGPLHYSVRQWAATPDTSASSISDDFWPKPGNATGDKSTRPFGCAVQANIMPDGTLLVAFSIHHALADGFSCTEIVKMLAEECRLELEQMQEHGHGQATKQAVGKYSGTPLGHSKRRHISMVPGVLDRSALMSTRTDRPPAVENLAVKELSLADLWRLAKVLVQHVRRTDLVDAEFTVSREAFADFAAELAASAAEQGSTRARSSSVADLHMTFHDFVCGLIMRCVIAARTTAGLVPQDATVSLCQAVNARRHLKHSRPSDESHGPYLGNAITVVRSETALTQLLSPGLEGIATAARANRAAVRRVDGEYVTAALSLYEGALDPRLVRVSEVCKTDTTAVAVTSWYRFKLASDWGGGWQLARGGAFKLPADKRPSGWVLVLPAARGGNSLGGKCEFVLTLPAPIMALLEADPVWRRYSQRRQ